MWVPLILVSLVIVGWLPVFYRRFSRDRKGRVVFRAMIWSFVMLVPAFLIAEFTFRLPAPALYPLAFLVFPVVLNLYTLVSHMTNNPPKND